ncbi:pyridoxal kinase [Paracoccus onubensis]|uniref:pyridoxal kinase n=1 Tax=Paracoccus onubensis TaxID=1675788 RepID=A0A418SZS5_9RHOB|nr:pyridoxal kinase [Paracoccus onubensis]RJE86452.1 pyridoxal kinase [Paracoccus onubensis]
MTETPRPPLVISVQSQVVHGHVGNSAALFPMQAAGLEVAAIPTVIFSNTPDYPTLRGAPVTPSLFADLLLGADERGLPQRATYLLSGYIGSVEVARLLADFVTRCKKANPDLIYICDPVMGDHAPGLYVPEEIAGVMQDGLLPLADIATPNSFELEHLSGRPIMTLEDLQQAATGLRLAPNAQLIATGCALADTPAHYLESVILGPDGISRHPTPHIPVALPGTGDLFTGLVVAGLGRNHPLPEAVDMAQAMTGRALDHARSIGAREVILFEPGFRRALLEI